jgi:hypothetical protein
MARGLPLSHLILDELGSEAPRREMIVVREDGSTYSADVPEDTDLGEVLDRGDVVGFDAA